MPQSKDIANLETIGVFLQGIECSLSAGRQDAISSLAASAQLRLDQIDAEHRPEKLVVAISEISRLSTSSGTPQDGRLLERLQELCADAIAASIDFSVDLETA